MGALLVRAALVALSWARARPGGKALAGKVLRRPLREDGQSAASGGGDEQARTRVRAWSCW